MSLIAYDMIAREAWDRLEQAADAPDAALRLFVLATAAEDGAPDARIMILRGASRRLARVWFHTDGRARKVAQLRRRPAACAVAWDAAAGLQLRLRGNATLHEGDDLAARHWDQISRAARTLYGADEPPGVPLRRPDPRLAKMRGQHERSDAAEAARKNFAVIEVEVSTIEWLQVSAQEQRCAVIRAAADWAVEPVAP